MMTSRNLLMLVLVTAVSAVTPTYAQAQNNRTLDELIRDVREQGAQEKREFAERVEEFRNNRNRQQELLRQAKSELESLDAENNALLQGFEENAGAIEEQERVLKQRVGYLNELHGVVRQIASDMQGTLETSMVSAEQPGRAAIADELATSSELPSISSLEELWQQALNEIAAAGKVTQFDAVVVDTNGEESQRRVTRVGTFNTFSDGLYLGYSADTGKLVEPQRQPSQRFQSMARELEEARDGIHPVAIDPTRGTLLSLLIQSPNIYARIKQGGPIGVVIIVLGVIGLMVAVSRFIILTSVYRKVRKQLQDKTPGENPLGRIMQVYYDNKHVDTDTLGHKLDETILRE
ncbi:MAG: MotA/TolQ/ExbB proton channel family protein, partial [Gammaproteobacteria bacterium]